MHEAFRATQRLAVSTRFSEFFYYWAPMKVMMLLQSQHPSLSVRNLKVLVAEFRSSLWSCPVWYWHLVCNLGFLWLYLRIVLSSEKMTSKETITGPGKHGATVYRDDQFSKYFDTLHYIVHFIQEKGPDVFEPWSYC